LFLVLLVYFPALHAPLSPVDDRAILQWFQNRPDLVLADLFTLTTENYYRPLLMLTYLVDHRVWGGIPSFLHLENVLLHFLNVTLVWGLAVRVARAAGGEPFFFPLASAALFALHPLNVEAVTWFAGRSDVLAAVFVLLAAHCLLTALVENRFRWVLASLTALAPGFLVKETALFFLPAALVLSWCWKKEIRPPAVPAKGRLPRWLFPVLAAGLLVAFVGFRAWTARSNLWGLADIASSLVSLEGASWGQLAAGAGFYVRKLFFPWPLNFTIYPVPAHFAWLAVVAFVAPLWFLVRRGIAAGFLVAAAVIAASALVALLARPGWTPVAERYMYIPLAFLVPGVVWGVARPEFARHVPAVASGVVLTLVCGVFGYTVFDRNLLWRDNLALIRDSAEKSPDFPYVRSVLADLLLEAGRKKEAARLIFTNRAPEGMRNRDFLELKRAEFLHREGAQELARDLVLRTRKKGDPLYFEFQKLLLKIDKVRLEVLEGEPRQEAVEETIELLQQLYRTYHDPFYRYQLGQLLLREKRMSEAARQFRAAAVEAPPGAHYRDAALALADRLESE
ncbi:MAG: hypothetical protein D6751_09590, partial [Deltaproteobacteria bacterium]